MVRPTSIESEKVFPVAGVILNKSLCITDNKTQDILYFLKGYYNEIRDKKFYQIDQQT